MKKVLILAVGFGLSLAAPLSAKKKAVHAPLPELLMNAKTVYIDNESGFADMGDKAYDELQNWARYTVVKDPKDADLVLVLRVAGTGTVRNSGGGNAYTWKDPSGNAHTPLQGQEVPVTRFAKVLSSWLTRRVTSLYGLIRVRGEGTVPPRN